MPNVSDEQPLAKVFEAIDAQITAYREASPTDRPIYLRSSLRQLAHLHWYVRQISERTEELLKRLAGSI